MRGIGIPTDRRSFRYRRTSSTQRRGLCSRAAALASFTLCDRRTTLSNYAAHFVTRRPMHRDKHQFATLLACLSVATNHVVAKGSYDGPKPGSKTGDGFTVSAVWHAT